MVSRPANLEEEKTTNDKDDWDNEFAEQTAFVSLVDVEALNKHGFEGEAEGTEEFECAAWRGRQEQRG